jgi:Zn-dependent protease
VRGGYLTIGAWRRAPVRVHWSLPVGALVFSQGRFAPGLWLGFFLIVLIHEIGHAVLVRRFRCAVVSIDVHAMGGVCRWAGEPTAVQRACIAWGGVLAQGVAFGVAYGAIALAGPPVTPFAGELAAAFISTNVWMIFINLLPVAPLDGAEAWTLPARWFRSLRSRRRARARGAGPSGPARGFAYEKRVATLERYSDEPSKAVQDEIDDALRRIGQDPDEDPKKILH